MALNPTHLMTAPTTHALTAAASNGGVHWFVSVLRCLLLLLLAFDHVSSPFHAHLHEGSSNMHQLAAVHVDLHAAAGEDALAHELHDDDAHAASEQHALASHSMLGIRAQTARDVHLSIAIDHSNAVLLPTAAPVATLSSVAAISSPRWRSRATTDIPFHLSLPPASRAPPLPA